MSKTFTLIALAAMALWSCTPATTTPKEGFTARYVNANRQSAVVYEPNVKTDKTGIAIVVMHSHADYTNFIANTELVNRGYTVMATAPTGSDSIETKVLCIKACVDYLRERGDIRKVILLGHSGGATTMTAYGYLAEQGRAGLEGMIYQDYSERMDNLPKVDGMLLLDANPGLSTILINSIDPNVTDESRGTGVRVVYTEDEPMTYMKAQQRRYAKLVAWAEQRLETIKAGKGRFVDDEPMLLPGAASMRFYNKLYSSDVNLLGHTRQAWPLIHADGSVTTEIVHSVRAPFQGWNGTDRLSAAEQMTVRSFLSTYAIRSTKDYAVLEDGFTGIDFTSNLTSPIGNIRGVTVPSLFMGMTGSYEYLASEAIYLNSPAQDKSIAFVEGASHMFSPDAKAAELHGADYGDTVKNLFDYVDQWLSQPGRF